ncbi:hypothetical protein HGO38_23935 [Rhizobium sp. CG5]|uniref:hypothetical protein n=1 Tax=Rhizobium sp. CG5 TaxID=2726076 RepID=UPI002033E122|nr:hypothetical protein [Rhizobium sp. CG5]MCM2476500.1 hypothetical protein [Rhizobium sp. CG5]
MSLAVQKEPPAADEALDLDGLIQQLMLAISVNPDTAEVRRKADEFLMTVPPQRALSAAKALSHAYPFYVPTMDDASAGRLALSLSQLSELVLRARLTASRARQPNILLACAPKSASTFIAAALCKALGVGQVSLALPTYTPYSSSMLGANLRNQETDELALMRHGLNGAGYVAQHHVRCTPYLCRQIELYNIRPIVTIRNYFDTLMSLDDMFMEWRQAKQSGNPHYFDDGLPADYTAMDPVDRYHLLVDANCIWYVQFLLNWRKCEAAGLVKPLWVSYEKDFLGDKAGLGERIADFVGREFVNPQRIAETFGDTSNGKKLRLNKGVSGRGSDIPSVIRDKVHGIMSRYRSEGDLSPLLGEDD